MGLLVTVEDEDGNAIVKLPDTTVFNHFLAPLDAANSHFLGVIDPWGKTMFNSLQIPLFLAEWRSVLSQQRDPKTIAMMKEVEKAALAVKDQMFLVFHGD